MTTPRDLRRALAYARTLGCTVQGLHRTGELIVSHGPYGRRVRLNGRRRDTPRRLVAFLHRLERRHAPEESA